METRLKFWIDVNYGEHQVSCNSRQKSTWNFINQHNGIMYALSFKAILLLPHDPLNFFPHPKKWGNMEIKIYGLPKQEETNYFNYILRLMFAHSTSDLSSSSGTSVKKVFVALHSNHVWCNTRSWIIKVSNENSVKNFSFSMLFFSRFSVRREIIFHSTDGFMLTKFQKKRMYK